MNALFLIHPVDVPVTLEVNFVVERRPEMTVSFMSMLKSDSVFAEISREII